MFGFLFWLFFIGLVIASFQDLKRREVDNWLNLFLLMSSLSFVFYRGILSNNLNSIFLVGILLVIMFAIMNMFYYGRVFAGGDAKLLFAMTVFFLGATFWVSLLNIGIFILFLMVSGSVYGISYSVILWFQNKKKVNKEMILLAKKIKIKLFILSSIIISLFGFFSFFFFLFGALVFLFPFLYIFAKGLENVSMVKMVSGNELREGDWLVDDVRVGSKVVKADWDGLSLKNIKLLRKSKKILIKEGIPFVPAFLFAFFEYVFLKGWFISLFIN